MTGCHAGPRNFENDNDRLRREVMSLTEQNASLKTRVESLEAAVKAEQRRTTPELPEGVQRPVTSRVEIGSSSGGIDTDGDGNDDTVRIYLRTLDQRGRFNQTLATVNVTIAAIPPGKDAVTLATKSFTAAEFDAAYRAGFTGTHYTLSVPVTTGAPAKTATLNVAVELMDQATDQPHTATREIRWRSR